MAERKRGVRSDKILFTPQDIKKIERLAGVGMSQDEIASIMGFERGVLTRNRKEIKELDDALRVGKAKAKGIVSETAFKMATSGRDAQMTKYWLNCQGGWKQTNTLELTGKDGGPVQMKSLSDDDLEKIVGQGNEEE